MHPATPRLKKALAISQKEATMMNHEYIGCEHLLVAIMRIGDGLACDILKRHGLTIQSLKEQILAALGKPLFAPKDQEVQGVVFQLGDVVHLRSGSVPMTVISNDGFLFVAWESNGEAKQFQAPQEAFELHEVQPKP